MAKTRRFIYGRSRQLVFYVFFSIWRNFFFFCFEYLNELPKRNREHEFFLMKRKPRILRAQIVFLLYLGTKYASFFSSFSLQFDGRRHVRHDDLTIFFPTDICLNSRNDRIQFFLRENWTSFSQIKHHNWPPIFLLEEQGIVRRSAPMLLPQPKIWYKKKSLELWKALNVYGNFAKPLPTDYVQVHIEVHILAVYE